MMSATADDPGRVGGGAGLVRDIGSSGGTVLREFTPPTGTALTAISIAEGVS